LPENRAAAVVLVLFLVESKETQFDLAGCGNRTYSSRSEAFEGFLARKQVGCVRADRSSDQPKHWLFLTVFMVATDLACRLAAALG